MVLNTRRLAIRPFEMSDAPALQAILGDAETMTFVEPPYDLPKTEAFLRDFCIGKQGAMAAALRETGQVIGYLLFHAVEPDVYELGWIFHRGYWRQGYAFEACQALVQHAFLNLGAHKAVAETVDAVKSAGLMRKLGMRQEGIRRQATRDHAGRQLDMLLYGLSREEYMSRIEV